MSEVQVKKRQLLVLGTGGTIAGRASRPQDNVGYTAGEVAVSDLLVPLIPYVQDLVAYEWAVEQVAQLDSKDMDVATWVTLAQRVAAACADEAVAGVVITHGTDTLEETACFLTYTVAMSKPVVLTCSMRPATSLAADGPQKLVDALHLAAQADVAGCWLVASGQVHVAARVSKVHPYRVDAFSSGDGGPAGLVEEGRVRWLGHPLVHETPSAETANVLRRVVAERGLPRVELVTSHAGTDGALVDALLAWRDGSPLKGLVVAGTGNGTLHHALMAALRRAQAQGVVVWRTTRCQGGPVVGGDDVWPPASHLSPVKARIALALHLALTSDGSSD